MENQMVSSRKEDETDVFRGSKEAILMTSTPAALKKPGCHFLVMSTTCNVVVRRGVRWGEPMVNAVS